MESINNLVPISADFHSFSSNAQNNLSNNTKVHVINYFII